MLLKFLKNLIAPKKCYSCGQLWHFLCPECQQKQNNHKPFCYLCKKESANFKIHQTCHDDDFFLDNLIVLTHYNNKIIKKLIKDSKYYWKKDILEDFSVYLWDLLLKNIDKKEEYIIIPRPMFFIKKIFRWYNQAEILAKNIAKYVDMEFQNNIVKKIKYTKSQSKLHRWERLKNLENTFKINKKGISKIKEKKVIIVDDVVSTWTTINEIAKLLKQNWVNEVLWLIIASD